MNDAALLKKLEAAQKRKPSQKKKTKKKAKRKSKRRPAAGVAALRRQLQVELFGRPVKRKPAKRKTTAKKRKPAKRKKAKKKAKKKLSKAAFLERMAKGRAKAKRARGR